SSYILIKHAAITHKEGSGMKNIVEIQGLQKTFGKFEALQDVSFTVKPVEVVGFIGPNGEGKSTTIRILLGMLKRSAGKAEIFGKDVWQESTAIHQSISYVPGDVALWGNLTGGAIIDLFMKWHGRGDQQKRNRLIERFELDPKKKAKSYSKGNRQQVGLIAALSVASELYILAGPTSGLYPLMESIFQEEIEKVKETEKAVLLSSHILSGVERLADKVAIIRQGKIVESGSLEELRHLTRSTVTLITEQDVTQMANVEGVYDFEQNNNQATFSADPQHLNII